MTTSLDAAASLTFVPWVRQGLASAMTTVDTLGAGQPAVADLSASLTVNGSAVPPVPLRLRGPADVIGIDRNQIVRMDPQPGTIDFEPTYFPSVEFDRADFPWLFTPAKAAANARLRPWLCLIVVRKQPGVTFAADAGGPLPTLQINAPAVPANELPKLSDSWAWVHSQAAAADSSAANVQAALQGSPALSLSRLICPRVLTPDTDYIACVVPTFEVGRKSGLGLTVTDANLVATNALAPAWAAAPTSVLLPVYHHWEFRTGAGGDFYTLAARLRPRTAPPELGQREIDIAQPGFELPSDFPTRARLLGETALRPLRAAGEPDGMAPWPNDTEAPFRKALAAIVNAPGVNAVVAPTADPLLAPPLYGQTYAGRDTASLTDTSWFDQLNLDPRLRGVAAYGTSVVQEHQEALMASAWEQAGELQEANQRLRQLQLSQAVGDSVYARHFARMSPEMTLRLTSPLLASASPIGASGTGTVSMRALVGETLIPLPALSPAMRRIGRERGPITRRLAAQGKQRFAQGNWVVTLNGLAGSLPAPSVPDIATFSAINDHLNPPGTLMSFGSVTHSVIAAQGGLPWFVVREEGQPVPMAYSFVYGSASYDSVSARDFRRAAVAHLQRVNVGRTNAIPALTFGADLSIAATSVAARTRPRQTVATLARTLVATPPTQAGTIAALVADTTTTTGGLSTIDIVPVFPHPMYEALRDMSQDLLLRGLESVPPDSVLGLETNRRFVEAFMVGLNNEMGRELLWRGFPTHRDGTYFDHFWGGGVDIPPLAQWGDRVLGDPAGSEPREQFVMLMRSGLLRRYPNALITLTPAVVTNGSRTPSTDPTQEILPAFTGTMQPDVTFLGFNVPASEVVGRPAGTGDGYYVVIQQHPTEPRFGLAPGVSLGAATHLSLGTAPPAGQPLNGLAWGRNAAHMAAILRRMPVRLAIHGSQFITVQS